MKNLLPALLLISISTLAQETTDTTRVLQELVVRAYEYDRPVLQVPASVSLIGLTELKRFNNTSILSAVNTVPGIRMEERSPGSYRFSIRGSSLRAPFGVRNVKVYWNDLPLTDGGGNTYLNQLDANSIDQLEIIKGPASSLYGSGTGGVLLLKTPQQMDQLQLFGSYLGGSFGLQNYQAGVKAGAKNSQHYVAYQHQQADGYREQTRMVRDQLTSTFRFTPSEKETLETAIFYTDLYYQTPGGLTQGEYDTNPVQARPAAGTQPGAAAQNAGVSLKSFYTGVSHQYKFSNKLNNRTGVFGNFVRFENAAIRNYERRTEQNAGARTVTDFTFPMGKSSVRLLGGGELLYAFSPIKTYQNNQGIPGVLQSDDEATSLQYNVFGQAELDYNAWHLSAGLSFNWVNYDLIRLSDVPPVPQSVNYKPVPAPRIAALRKINPMLSVHASASWGFSPPTLAEVRPSNGTFNTDLQAEKGLQLETGLKGYLFANKLFIETALYHFQLKETIVVRRDADGADYFVNAGGTNQNGIELMASYSLNLSAPFSDFKVWSGLTLNHYVFNDYTKDNTSFDGNSVTGTPNHVITSGVDLTLWKKLSAHVTGNYSSEIPLDDANTVYADSYFLLGLRIGYELSVNQNFPIEFYLGGDNLLDEKYSLGNDLNAAGGRYFNAAATRNFYLGIALRPIIAK